MLRRLLIAVRWDKGRLADVRSRLDRVYDLVEKTSEFDMADFAHRIRDGKEHKEHL